MLAIGTIVIPKDSKYFYMNTEKSTYCNYVIVTKNNPFTVTDSVLLTCSLNENDVIPLCKADKEIVDKCLKLTEKYFKNIEYGPMSYIKDRVFTNVTGFTNGLAAVIIHPNNTSTLLNKDGHVSKTSYISLEYCLDCVKRGVWKEIADPREEKKILPRYFTCDKWEKVQFIKILSDGSAVFIYPDGDSYKDNFWTLKLCLEFVKSGMYTEVYPEGK